MNQIWDFIIILKIRNTNIILILLFMMMKVNWLKLLILKETIFLNKCNKKIRKSIKNIFVF